MLAIEALGVEPASGPSDRRRVMVWLDNHLPPALAPWARGTLGATCVPIRDLGMQRSTDVEIFRAARAAEACVMTQDDDFADLVRLHGAPPQIVLLRYGNTSNARLQRLLAATWPTVQAMLTRGEPLVELADPPV